MMNTMTWPAKARRELRAAAGDTGLPARWLRTLATALTASAALASLPAGADTDAGANAGANVGAGVSAEAEAKAAFEAARVVAVTGPTDVPLAAQATLKLPPGTLFIPQPQATRLLNAMGNPGQDSQLQGLVFPDGKDEWFVTVRYEDSGHVKDDDARDWKADDLLDGYRKGTEASNEERVKMGVPALEILGWAEKPAYDAGTHRLVWAMSSREKGAPAGEAQGVNYNTYVLGRDGYFMLNLVTSLNELPQHKPHAQTLLSSLSYLPGKGYADFNASTDRIAEYGLAALVVGIGAKKLGLLAAAGLFFAKFAKVILIGLAVAGGGFMKFFKGRKTSA